MNPINECSLNDKCVKLIAKSYNPLDYNKKLQDLLSFAFPDATFEEWEKYQLHKLVNDIVISKHHGEQALKHSLFKAFYKKKIVAAFEIKVKNSRADFLTINGASSSFEIKSNIDNLYKLKKQASDYVLAFDYNYLVIDERHFDNALGLVPKSFGLWSFKNGKKKIHREASLNKNIDAEIQLSLLSKKDLQRFFNEVDGDKKQILSCFYDSEINTRFKKALKAKYENRWNFIVSNADSILPIDIQFFFKTNVLPQYIYCQ